MSVKATTAKSIDHRCRKNFPLWGGGNGGFSWWLPKPFLRVLTVVKVDFSKSKPREKHFSTKMFIGNYQI